VIWVLGLTALLVVGSAIVGLGTVRIRRGTDHAAHNATASRLDLVDELAVAPLPALIARVRDEVTANGWTALAGDLGSSEADLAAAIARVAAASPGPAFDAVGGLADVAAALAIVRGERRPPPDADPWAPPG
jgi:hypothetical protein